MISSGVICSLDVKLALLRHLPQCVFIDLFGSSEGGFMVSECELCDDVKQHLEAYRVPKQISRTDKTFRAAFKFGWFQLIKQSSFKVRLL